MPGRRSMVAAVAILGCALPASASADLVVTQTASPLPVKKGELVTITATVTNPGPAPVDSELSQVEIFPLRGSTHQAAVNLYRSVTASVGTCTQTTTGAYQVADCFLGAMVPGAAAQIVAVVQVNESMTHTAAAKNGAPSELGVAASTPAVITGANQIKLSGLPTGCVPGDFALTVTVAAKHVRRVSVSLNRGYDDQGEGVTWVRSARGRRLAARVPASGIFDARLGKPYTLRIKATRRGQPALRRGVVFELCQAAAPARPPPDEVLLAAGVRPSYFVT